MSAAFPSDEVARHSAREMVKTTSCGFVVAVDPSGNLYSARFGSAPPDTPTGNLILLAACALETLIEETGGALDVDDPTWSEGLDE